MTRIADGIFAWMEKPGNEVFKGRMETVAFNERDAHEVYKKMDAHRWISSCGYYRGAPSIITLDAFIAAYETCCILAQNTQNPG